MHKINVSTMFLGSILLTASPLRAEPVGKSSGARVSKPAESSPARLTLEQLLQAVEAERAAERLSPLELYAITPGVEGGVAREGLQRFMGQDTTRLQAMLRDPQWQIYWARIAAVLGGVGGPEVIEYLMDYIDEPAPSTRPRAYALMALGSSPDVTAPNLRCGI